MEYNFFPKGADDFKKYGEVSFYAYSSIELFFNLINDPKRKLGAEIFTRKPLTSIVTKESEPEKIFYLKYITQVITPEFINEFAADLIEGFKKRYLVFKNFTDKQTLEQFIFLVDTISIYVKEIEDIKHSGNVKLDSFLLLEYKYDCIQQYLEELVNLLYNCRDILN
ncbi:MAG: hypothetical protein ABI721_00205 [Candidatus Dojkabacteria bacterium]